MRDYLTTLIKRVIEPTAVRPLLRSRNAALEPFQEAVEERLSEQVHTPMNSPDESEQKRGPSVAKRRELPEREDEVIERVQFGNETPPASKSPTPATMDPANFKATIPQHVPKP